MRSVSDEQLQELFGTCDYEQLAAIAAKLRQYEAATGGNPRGAGRHPVCSEPDMCRMLMLHREGETIRAIAEKYGITRQTVSKYLQEAGAFTAHPDAVLRLNYMNSGDLCSTIDVNFKAERIYVKNYTEKPLLRAFGVNQNPDWKDFERFLRERCLPESRDGLKDILRELQLPFFDPLCIIRRTQGRLAGDNQWIQLIERTEEADAGC